MSFLRKAMTLENEARERGFVPERNVETLLKTIENIYQIGDLDTLLDRILYEARKYVHADAGTLYLKENDRIFFSYVHNDTLFKDQEAERRYLYSSQSLPVNRDSLAGYVADTGDTLLIDDVYDIRSDVDFSFNPEFDRKSSYRTKSMLIVPLATGTEAIVGVLQLINAKDKSGNLIPFSGTDRLYIMQFAQSAANAIEKAKLNREMVLRMVELSELRDPFETGRHAERVGSYAIEIYSKWAERRGISMNQIRNTREILMPAAMLHDIGKVAVSDIILQKPDSLSREESAAMKLHTVFGARMFRQLNSPWDKMARDVILNHHERWDGTGYPGNIDDLYANPVKLGPGKRAEEIPIYARIVTVSDVFDALISRRAYKTEWPLEKVLAYFQEQSGRQFDPELVDILFEIKAVLLSILDKFRRPSPQPSTTI